MPRELLLPSPYYYLPMDTSDIKARFGIVGNDPELLRAIDMAVQVAPIQLSVLIIGESGTGKEVFPKIIHSLSARKHCPYVAVNCGAIPEGTIDSELFGHEKGAFTGALNERKGYFEEANTGTIFLDEIGELPLATQAKLLRVLEKGEYMRVGSSVVKKTDVRIVAATNVDLEKAIRDNRFREDLFYRLNGVMIRIPPLRKRPTDIRELFHKFTNDFADKNHIPPIRLTSDAVDKLASYSWPGNVRQLKNMAEQLTVLAPERTVTSDVISQFIPQSQPLSHQSLLPQPGAKAASDNFTSDREILYKVLFDMRQDVNDLKRLVLAMLNGQGSSLSPDEVKLARKLFPASKTDTDDTLNSDIHVPVQHPETHHDSIDHLSPSSLQDGIVDIIPVHQQDAHDFQEVHTVEPEITSIAEAEKNLIKRALVKFKNNRRRVAKELQISERTLYRKIHDYGLDD